MLRISQDKLKIEKDKIIRQCTVCGGVKCSVCQSYAQITDSLAHANIPVLYWFTKMKDFIGPDNLKKETIDYIRQIETNYQNGINICFTGGYGVGKTTAACAVLKNAIFKKRTAYYVGMTDMVGLLTNFQTRVEAEEVFKMVDYLCIDEVDSRHFGTSDDAQRVFGSSLEKIIRYRVSNRYPTILVSNNDSMHDVFVGQYKRVVDSLLNSAIQVKAVGRDIRKIQVQKNTV